MEKTPLTKAELIHKASYAIYKGYDFETMKYCDEMYGIESQIDEVWKYVIECKKIGEDAFIEKYSDYNLMF